MHRLKAILIKEIIQIRRDNLTLAMMILLPIIQLIIFGFAINTDVKHLPTAVYDQSMSQESRELLSGFSASGYFDMNYTVSSAAEVNRLIDSGKAKVGILIPPDLVKNLKHGSPTPIQVLVDASDSMSASSAIAAAQSIGILKSQEARLSGSHSSGANLYDVRVRSWYNPDFVTSYYMLPGIMGTILTMTMVMITSMSIVREWENGTMEQLIVTPVKGWEIMAGKIIPYIFIGYGQMTVAIITGVAVFGMPIRGSLLLLYGLTSLFIIASLGLGIFISTMSHTQMQAMQMSFFVFLPSILLSGFVFPRSAMPEIFQWLGALLPLTYYVDMLRGILLRGNSFSVLWTEALALTAFITVVFGGAVAHFKKSLD